MAEKEFEKRTALVTGGSRGMTGGRAICLRLAEAGAKVAINYAADADAARETRELVRATGAAGRIYKADVSERDQCEAMFAEIKDELGPSICWNRRHDDRPDNRSEAKSSIWETQRPWPRKNSKTSPGARW